MTGIQPWLERNNLQKFEKLFREHQIDMDVLVLLEESDLEKMGISALGDRKRIVWAIKQASGAEAPAAAPQSERRRVTLLFCDIVNYTGTLVELDVEDRHSALEQYYAWFEDEVTRFRGIVQRFEGDGVRALFGYPGADENAPELAVRAGLALAETIRQFRPFDLKLQVRITIATGLAVVGPVYGQGTTRERTVSGDIAHLVARMKNITPRDAVVVSDETRRVTGDLFTYESLGAHEFAHTDDPESKSSDSNKVQVWRVAGEGAAKSRSAITYSRTHLTPLISREEEIALLKRRWESAVRGKGQVVLVSGEAGIGKSRMTRDFRRGLPEESHHLLRYYCLPSYENTTLRPIINQLLGVAQISPSDTATVKQEKLLVLMKRLDIEARDTTHLFADLLSVPLDDENSMPTLSPNARRRKTLDALENMLVAQARKKEALIVFEDLHWIDATSMELLNRLIRNVPMQPVLLILTFRPDGFEPPWPNRHYMTSITVNRLSPEHSVEMVSYLMKSRELLPAEKKEIIEITEGVPLFIEEICQAVIELETLNGTPPSPEDGRDPRIPTPMPRPVNDALIARLNRLGEVKEIAQMAAAIGRGFTLDLLTDIANIDETELRRYLQQLSDAQIIYQRSSAPSVSYEFNHGLLRDAAYGSLLRSVRKRLHARIAAALEERYADIVESEPEQLAHHLTEASLTEKAITFWLKAGERAVERSANVEAIAHLSQGLRLVTSLTDGSRRRELELRLRLAMGSPLLMVEGHSARKVESTYFRARELCQSVGPSKELFSAIVGLWRFYLSDMQFDKALELAEQSTDIAQQLKDESMSQESYLMIGSCLLYMGNPRRANEYFARANALLNRVRRPALVLSRASDPSVMGLSWASWARWKLGYPEQALALNEEAIDLATSLRRPYSLEFAHFFAAVLYQRLRDFGQAEVHAQKVIDLAEDQDFNRWSAGSRVIKGWTLARRGNHNEGLRLVKEGIESWSGRLGLPRLHAILAEVYMGMAEFEQALRALEEAASLVEETKSFMYYTEICRLTGVVCFKLAQEGFEQERFQQRAEQQLEKALEIARGQNAKSLELRAAIDLSSYWQATRKHKQGLVLLEETASWFTEGFDTADFRAAKEQLKSLRQPQAADHDKAVLQAPNSSRH